MKKKIIISGGTGFIGRKIISKLNDEEFEIFILTRDVNNSIKIISQNNVNFINWDFKKSSNDIIDLLNDSYSVIILAGASIGGTRWNEEYKKVLYDSRIITAKKIVEAISKCTTKPKSLIVSSAIGYYGMIGNETVTEDFPNEEDFLANLCYELENQTLKANDYGVRIVCIRTGLVLDKNEGVLKKLISPFKLFIGGHIGNGNQWFSWIHINDLVNLYLFAMNNQNITGAINGTTPNPVTNKEFCKTLGKVLKRPSYLPIPGFALKIFIGEFTNYLVTGRKVIPKKALDNNFVFNFPYLESTLMNLMKKYD